jgi:hypothetical protein
MKKIAFIFIFICFVCSVKAQGELKPTKLNDMIAYNGEGKYGIIIIQTHEYFRLKFSTNLDGPNGSLIEKETKKVIGGVQIEYTLTFDAKKASGTVLNIECQGYRLLSIPITLSANEAIKYYVDDPGYPGSKNCSKAHKLYADEFFDAAAYDKAKDEYQAALDCWDVTFDVDSAELKLKISNVDQITSLLKDIADAESKKDYHLIYDIYRTAYTLNAKDPSLKKKYLESMNDFNNECNRCYEEAERLFLLKKYSEASDMFQQVIDWDCPNRLQAARKQPEAQRMHEEGKNLLSYHVLTYEYQKSASFGFSSGNYKVNKTSGYFTLRFDPQIFETFRLEKNGSLAAEADMSFGFTIPLKFLQFPVKIKDETYTGLWLFLGPGMTDLLQVSPEDSTPLSETSRYTNHLAVSPEAGLLLKIPLWTNKSHLILRYTYQYRYTLKKDDQDLIGKSKNVIGFGFSF